MLANADPKVRKKGEDELNSLLLSNSREDKLAAVSILAELKDEYDHPGHAQLINDENPHVRTLAMKAVGKACLPDTVLALCRHILQHEKQVINSLFEAGSMAVPQIGQLITNHKAHDSLRRKLIMLCGKIGGENAQNLLIELLKTRDHDTTFIIKALYRCRYTADEHTMKLFENIARKQIIYGVEMLHMQQDLSKKEAYADVLNNSLQLELQEIREVLLCVFGCMYDREKINQVKYGLDARHRESIANAMEIVELLVKKDMGRQFNTMFEKSSIEQRCASLRSLFTEKHFGKIENILGRILSEKPIQYYNWTKAYSLYISKKYVHHLDNHLFKKYIHSDNKLLKETALFASSTS
jgi:HEAT repeat protein